ncbi:uncharacterized, partial [Tachysurus ichikawai]
RTDFFVGDVLEVRDCASTFDRSYRPSYEKDTGTSRALIVYNQTLYSYQAAHTGKSNMKNGCLGSKLR